jgi:PBP1b-binding outer membrane lipoprotein LpoB
MCRPFCGKDEKIAQSLVVTIMFLAGCSASGSSSTTTTVATDVATTVTTDVTTPVATDVTTTVAQARIVVNGYKIKLGRLFV